MDPGVLYAGSLDGVFDNSDWYRIDGSAGDSLHIIARGDAVACMRLYDAAAQQVDHPATCTNTPILPAEIRYELRTTGVWYFSYSYFDPQYYHFNYTLDGSVPGVPLSAGPVGPVDGAPDFFGGDPGPRPAPRVTPASQDGDHVVIAVVDTGVNPYHEFYRGAGLVDHPSTWLPRFPGDVASFDLALGAPDYESALDADRDEWDLVQQSSYDEENDTFDAHVYTFPGTRIVAGISFGNDPPGPDPPPDVPLIVDGHGHGTMTSALAGGYHLATRDDNVLLVIVQGGDERAGIRWAARQPWIDAISLSIGTVANTPYLLNTATQEATWEARLNGKPLFKSSGNGVTGTGGAPDRCSTYTSSYLGPWWVTRIGASYEPSNNPTYWHCTPVDVIAATSVSSAHYQHLEASRTGTGTSAATPNAAGHYAHLLLDARRAGLALDRFEVLQVLMNATRPAEMAVQLGAEPSNPLTAPQTQGFGVVHEGALERARGRLHEHGTPEPRPDMDDFRARDHETRVLLWGGVPGEGIMGADRTNAPAEVPQDDAGSAGDAPDGMETQIRLAPVVEYMGFLDGWVDRADWYRIAVKEGDMVDVWSEGALHCLRIHDGQGVQRNDAAACSTGYALPAQTTVEVDETADWFLEVSYFVPNAYRFGYTIR